MTNHVNQVADTAHLAALLVRGQHRATDESHGDMPAAPGEDGLAVEPADLDDGEPLSH